MGGDERLAWLPCSRVEVEHGHSSSVGGVKENARLTRRDVAAHGRRWDAVPKLAAPAWRSSGEG
eukprot:scaffold15611_cov110-Isochrysis_galbana.AAC.5